MEIRERVTRAMFIEVPFNVETGEAERIAVDWTAKGGGVGTSCEFRSFSERTSPDQPPTACSRIASAIPKSGSEDASRSNTSAGEVCYAGAFW